MEPSVDKAFQPTFRNLKWGMSSAVNVRLDKGQHLYETFHYHPQVELIALYNCRGNAILGTKVCPLEQDEILLIGKNTPHGFFYNHQRDEGDYVESPHAVVVQFDENFMGRDFFSIPESYCIRRILASAREGFVVKQEKRPIVAELMKRMLHEHGFKKILLLLEALSLVEMREDGNGSSEVNRKIKVGTLPEDDGRLQEIWSYTSENYMQPIRIDDVASRVNLTKESFCRFFKAKTNITYMEYLFSYRIEKAKLLLLENRMSVKEIGYSCGFHTLSNFYYQFRKIVRSSPLEYQEKLFRKL